jgi:hypothetical protein
VDEQDREDDAFEVARQLVEARGYRLYPCGNNAQPFTTTYAVTSYELAECNGRQERERLLEHIHNELMYEMAHALKDKGFIRFEEIHEPARDVLLIRAMIRAVK